MELNEQLNGLVVDDEGTQCWYQYGQLHRLDGPAVIYPSGVQYWYQHGQSHREDGPAAIWADGEQRWYLNGWPHSFDSWLDLINATEKERTFLVLRWS